jgi:tricorn protease-like protein
MKEFCLIIFLGLAYIWEISAQYMFPVRRITSEAAQEGFATWSPDGKMIAFTSTRSGSFDIWIMEVDALKIKTELGMHGK